MEERCSRDKRCTFYWHSPWNQISVILIYLIFFFSLFACSYEKYETFKCFNILPVSSGCFMNMKYEEWKRKGHNRAQKVEWQYSPNKFPFTPYNFCVAPFFFFWSSFFFSLSRCVYVRLVVWKSLAKSKEKDLKNGTMQTFRIYYHLESAKA